MCKYCELLKNKENVEVLYEDEIAFTFIKNFSQIITIPKKHFSTIEEVPHDVFSYIIVINNRISSLYFQANGFQGTNIIINNGKTANQKTDHLAINTIFRAENDDYNFTWSPTKVSKEDLINTQELLLQGMKEPVKVEKKKEVVENEKESPKKKKDDKEIVDYRIKQLIRTP